MTPTRAPLPNRRFYGWLGLAFLAFVLYGSWVPFTFAPLAPEEAVAQFRMVLASPVSIESRSDWLANVLLAVPAAFCLMGCLGADRPWSGWPGDAVLVLPVCLAVSVLAEFGQLFLPGRVSALNDIVAQGLGAALGGLVWVLFGQRLTGWARELWERRDPAGWEAHLLPAYLALLVALYLLPLDLTLSPGALYRKLKEGRVNLVPLALIGSDAYSYAGKMLLGAAYFTVLGLLCAGVRGREGPAAGRALGGALLFVVGLNGMKLLVESRSFDVTDVLVQGLAVLGGGWLRLAGGSLPAWRGCLLAGWLALLAFVTWQPFDFDLALAGPRLQALPALPFAELRQGQEMTALQNVLEKMVLFLALGALLTSWRPTPQRGGWLPVFLVGLGVAATLEAGQLALASRTATLSDVYVETAGAVFGSLLTRRILAPATRPAGERMATTRGWALPTEEAQ